jgi:DNA repair photolyase
MSMPNLCDQPIERHLQLTRRYVAVRAEFRNPVIIITKNHLVTRDLDLLRELAAHHAGRVNLFINSLDSELARKLEPRASYPAMRLRWWRLWPRPQCQWVCSDTLG